MTVCPSDIKQYPTDIASALIIVSVDVAVVVAVAAYYVAVFIHFGENDQDKDTKCQSYRQTYYVSTSNSRNK